MKLDKAKKRDKKFNKRKHGMRVSGKSVSVLGQAQAKRDSETLSKKKVVIEYWVDGIRLTRKISASSVDSWTQSLRNAGASGIKVIKGRAE